VGAIDHSMNLETKEHSHFENIFAYRYEHTFVGMGAGGGLAISTFARW
jgi:hypothetical protein